MEVCTKLTSYRVGLELTKAYLEKGWKVVAAVRDPKSMPKLDGGEVVTVKLDAGEKEDAKKVIPTSLIPCLWNSVGTY